MSEAPELRKRIDAASAEYGVDPELIAQDVAEHGLDPEQAAELRQLDVQRMADLAAANGRPPPDDETVKALGNLGGLLGGLVEFLDITYDGECYVFVVKHPDTGEPVDTRRIDSDRVLTLSNLQAAIYDATDGLPTEAPVRNKGRWLEVMRTIRAARRMVEPDEDPTDEWRHYLASYLEDRLGADRDHACQKREPFEQDGSVWVYRPALQAFVANVLKVGRMDKAAAQAGLHLLGFEPKQVWYYDARGKRRSAHYYRGDRPG